MATLFNKHRFLCASGGASPRRQSAPIAPCPSLSVAGLAKEPVPANGMRSVAGVQYAHVSCAMTPVTRRHVRPRETLHATFALRVCARLAVTRGCGSHYSAAGACHAPRRVAAAAVWQSAGGVGCACVRAHGFHSSRRKRLAATANVKPRQHHRRAHRDRSHACVQARRHLGASGAQRCGARAHDPLWSAA